MATLKTGASSFLPAAGVAGPVTGKLSPTQFDLVLAARDVAAILDDAATGTDFTLAVDSTAPLVIAVQDQKRTLISSGVLDHDENGKLDNAPELMVDGAWYRLAGINKAADTFTLTFEDRTVARLRAAKGKLKPKSGENHVKFARRLVAMVGGAFVTPTGVAVVKAETPMKAKQERSDADDRREKGIGSGANVTVKGAKADKEQIRNMEIALGIAAKHKAGAKATLALVLACIVESTFRNLPHGDRDSKGILQLRTGIWGEANARSVERSVTMFLTKGFWGKGSAISIARKNPSMSAGQVAQNTQGSGVPDAYDHFLAEGRKIVDAYGGTAATGDEDSSSAAPASASKALVQRGTTEDPDENSWTCLGRIGAAKGWRVFAVRNVVIYAREQDLIRSRPRATLSEDSPGVDWIDWEWTPNKKVNTATLQCRANMRDLDPGVCVVLENEGPADGRWLVSSFKRSRTSVVATVDLRRGTELLKPEPVQEDKTATTPATRTADVDSPGGTKLAKTYPGSPVPGQRPHASTHPTGGLPGYPAYDYMCPAGTPCVAPVSGKIDRLSGKNPKLGGPAGGALGYSIYLSGNGKSYFMTHLDKVKVKAGQHVKQGEQIAEAAHGPPSWSTPHVHMGVKG
jgi:murein DD-endopeptidase MepM/ murein hydrolase activator NlpD